MAILIYGGSFNPPHGGHVYAVNMAAKALKPDRIFLIPTAIPPHKEVAEGTPAGEARLEMTRLAAGEIPGAEVLDLELCRGGKSYTVDTLRALKEQHPGEELVFLLGTDMLLTLDEWRKPEEILSMAVVALFPRDGEQWAVLEKKARELTERFGGKILLIEGNPLEVSSTELRHALGLRGGRDLLPEAVYEYIIRHRLYGAKPEFSWLREKAHAHLKPKRVPHVLGTEQEAISLAKRWGLSAEDAAEAAICHDITKRLGLEEQLRLCARYGIMADNYESVSEKLLHAKTGAELAQDLFGLTDEVAEAIRWHTTGRAGMNELQQIIYLADYIEPTRSGFEGLEELRKAAYEDLDGAMELGLRMSLGDVIARGNLPHEDTLHARQYFLKRLRNKGAEPIHVDGVPDDIE